MGVGGWVGRGYGGGGREKGGGKRRGGTDVPGNYVGVAGI